MRKRGMIIKKKFTFEAAHMLPLHDGPCRRLHGHSWVMWISVGTDIGIKEDGPKSGMLMDFGDMKSIVNPIVDDYLDHHYLNDSTGLSDPTSENICIWIHGKLLGAQWPKGIRIEEIEIEETCTSSCRLIL